MRIVFDSSISDYFQSSKCLEREYGKLAKYIMRAINRLTKADISNHWLLPGNPHELKHLCKGVYSVTLHHPHRMVYRVDRSSNSVVVLGIVDYHSHQRVYSRIIA